MDIHFLYLALQQLPEEQRECIILFEISGFSIKEIAQTQQAGESAVKQRLKRGREKLIEILHARPLEHNSTNKGE
jgi:RNA polymerase sigma-70 factor (ECF subfamily)